eukprot:TRINITY_DN2335_c0_g1_i1.p1 TRINITY_DN2335_c0_g1~~TRINITY_DN2335_c0_g1_i1.p1  ORF type:complete len:379 (-),score=50.84 TRINITY_DN2335_c0_g1_i1:491-1627(-)
MLLIKRTNSLKNIIRGGQQQQQQSSTGSIQSMSALLNKALHKRTTKAPEELVGKLHTYLSDYERAATPGEKLKLREEIDKYLIYVKSILTGEEGKEPSKENALLSASRAANTNLLYLLVDHLKDLDFEGRKIAAIVFNEILKQRDESGVSPGVQYVIDKPEILSHLVKGYEDQGVALVCGTMLRDCINIEELAKVVLDGQFMEKIFDKVQVLNFEIASDAFLTLKNLLSTHKKVVAQYLVNNYHSFFERYTQLLRSENFVTRVQSLKLLGELMTAKENVNVTIQYVSDVQNLILIMNLLKDEARTIQFEAFHVFKVFVANPKKPQPIVEVLVNNKSKLLKYLEDFLSEREEDQQFMNEKAVIIKEILDLKITTTAPKS